MCECLDRGDGTAHVDECCYADWVRFRDSTPPKPGEAGEPLEAEVLRLREITSAACQCALLALSQTKDQRVLACIETVEARVRGEVGIEKVREARRAANARIEMLSLVQSRALLRIADEIEGREVIATGWFDLRDADASRPVKSIYRDKWVGCDDTNVVRVAIMRRQT
jgi:hypothetical protein